MKRCNKYLFTSLLAVSMLFSSYKSVHAHDNIDEKGKVHLYWQGNYYVDNYVDYTKTLVDNNNSIEWTVTFNSAKEQWVYPDFSVFLPKGVKAPKEITYEHYYWDGTVDSKKRSNTQWHYDWKKQKTNFNQEFDKFSGYTGWSPSLDKFYKLKTKENFLTF